MKNAIPDTIHELITNQTVIFWFRRDLRLEDNAGLYYALRENKNVIPLFIFDTNILSELDDKSDRRVTFIHQALEQLHQTLTAFGTSLLVLAGDPVTLFKTLKPRVVYTNHDYEPYARKRDEEVEKILTRNGIGFKTYKDQVIFDKNEVLKDDGHPYTVFTPYSKKWKAQLNQFFLKSYPTQQYVHNFKKIPPVPIPNLSDIGFAQPDASFPPRVIPVSIIEHYDRHRDFPGVAGTTRISVHLRFGTVSIRKLVQVAMKKNAVWLNELIWREFYHMILWHFPQVEKAFKPLYDRIAWRNNEDEFRAWCAGRTGYPLVDAGMRELNETGFMHNRVRMVTASFLTKHLLIDWRWGEAYFAKKLLDFDLASNNGGWQWAAGSGCDAAPYFRIFNPALQLKKFDSDLKYVKKWLPEFNTENYPTPIVDHTHARDRALKAYKKALEQQL